MSKELIWSEDDNFVYGLKSDFKNEEEFTTLVKKGPCIVKNIQVTPCLLASNVIYSGLIIPLSSTDIVIANYYMAEVEEEL